MSTPPSPQSPHLIKPPAILDSDLIQQEDSSFDRLDKNVVDAARQNLAPAETSVKSTGWWGWNLFNWGKNEVVVSETTKEERPQEEELEQQDLDFQEALDLNKRGCIAKEVSFQETTIKTDQIGQGFWNNLGGNFLLGKAQSFANRGGQALLSGATEVIQRYVGSYASNINKLASIQESKQLMKDHLKDHLKDGTQFVKLFDQMAVLLNRIASEKIGEQLEDGFLAQNILSQKQLILDLLEINLAKGFVNLAQQLAENKASIPHNDTQSTLVNILSLFSQKAGKHINMQSLTTIEKKYLEAQASLSILTKQLFPTVGEKEVEDPTKKTKKQLIQEYIKTTYLGRRREIINELFPDIECANQDQDRLKNIEAFVETLITLSERHQELHQLFSQVADDVLMYLFPNKFAGVEIPYFLQGGFGETLYDFFIKDTLVDLLQESCEPLMPIIERDQNRIKLAELSGSDFLGNLSLALSKDLFYLLPASVKSYESIAHKLFVLLSNQQEPNLDQVNQFAKEIAELVKLSKEKNITHKALLEAYAKAANIELNQEEQSQLIAKLEENQAKEEIKKVLITPQEIAELIGKSFPYIDSQLQQTFANELQGMLQNDSDVYQNISTFAKDYVEGVLLRLFITLAEKNPKEEGKDTLVVLTEKLLDGVAKKYPEWKGKAPEEVAKSIYEFVVKDVLGVDSSEAFKELPDSIQAKVFEILEIQLTGIITGIQQSLVTLEDSDNQLQQVKQDVKKFGIADGATAGYADILAHDLAHLLMTAIPDVLTQIGGEKMRGVNMISKSVESYLGELIRGNLKVAELLLNYTEGSQFQQLLGDNLLKLADQNQLVEDKQKATYLLGNLILFPLNIVLNQVFKFEKQKDAEFNQKLMANILFVAADHLKYLNEAKEQARIQGRTQILHQDFVQAAGNDLHPGVPKTPVTYQQSIDAIHKRLYPISEGKQQIWIEQEENLRKAIVRIVGEESQGTKTMSLDDIVVEIEKIHQEITGDSSARLTFEQKSALKARDEKGLSLKDIIRQEAESSKFQRQTDAYGPATKTVMKMLFPNGKKDLTFVPEELRGQVWKMFKKDLFPVLLPMITELLLDPDVINEMVLSSLETMRDSLKGEIVLKLEESKDVSLKALDQASGILMVEALKAVKLPEWIKKQIVDPKTHQVHPAMVQALGYTLRKQFDKTFIKDKLELALKKMVERDANGNYMLNTQPSSKINQENESKKLAKDQKREKIKNDLKRVSREVVDVSISYFIRNQWSQAQARFDELVETIFGKMGTKLKHCLDAVFGFIFFKIIGTMLSFLFSPVKGWIKEKIYAIFSLDENREMLLALLGQAPSDQPLTGGHVVYNENLIFKMGEALKKTVEETLNKPVVPQPNFQDDNTVICAEED
jgi:hypothetical protein